MSSGYCPIPLCHSLPSLTYPWHCCSRERHASGYAAVLSRILRWDARRGMDIFFASPSSRFYWMIWIPPHSASRKTPPKRKVAQELHVCRCRHGPHKASQNRLPHSATCLCSRTWFLVALLPVLPGPLSTLTNFRRFFLASLRPVYPSPSITKHEDPLACPVETSLGS